MTEHAAGGPASTGYVSELSEKGVFVHTLSPRPLNSILPVTIMIHSIPLKLKAVVLHSIAAAPAPQFSPFGEIRVHSRSRILKKYNVHGC